MADTRPLPLPRLNMRQWRIVWPGQPWVQPIGEDGEHWTPMCRFCHRLYDSHQADCVTVSQ
jgi:hypothetical protein